MGRVEHEPCEREAAHDVARAGLDSLHARMRATTEDGEVPLDEVFASRSGAPLETATIRGTGERTTELSIPLHGQRLRGDALQRQLDDWTARGIMEPSAAEAVRAVATHPEWIKIGTVHLELASGSDEQTLFQRIRADLLPRLESLEGQYFWRVPLGRVSETAVGDKRVKAVSVYREFPSILRVVIEPYTPILAYLSDDGRAAHVNSDLPHQSPAPDRPGGTANTALLVCRMYSLSAS